MREPVSVITGAAGFIGSHLADRLLEAGHRVVGIDNFLLGNRANLSAATDHAGFSLIEADLNDEDRCLSELGRSVPADAQVMVWHLAANSDIAAGVNDPDVDFRNTFLTTFSLLKTMRRRGWQRLAFPSSSAVHGPHDAILREDTGPLRPASNYGAMKLASEGAISAALETALERAWVFRFPNVVGNRATHGVIFDFLRKLRENPRVLTVLGDGRQEKPYLHVGELIEAMLFIVGEAEERLNVFNIGADGSTTTVKYIAEHVVERVAPGARIAYGSDPSGWPGDVPKFNYCIANLKRLGWRPKLSSNEAVDLAIDELATQ